MEHSREVREQATAISRWERSQKGDKMKRKYLWLCVTADEYELPIAISDTATELARMTNTTANNIREAARIQSSGKTSGRKFVKVKYE